MKGIGFFPAGSKITASSRIRVFSMLPHLDSKQIQYQIKPSFINIINLETIFIQKKITSAIIDKARFAKILGRRIIYDLDDFGPALFGSTSQENLMKLLKLADKVTTGCEAQRKILEDEYSITNVSVLPSLIDYFPEGPVQNVDQSNENLKIIWFGANVNFSSFAKYIEMLLQIPSIEIFVVTNSEMIDALSLKYPRIHFMPWNLETFIPILRSCQLSILTHDGSIFDQAKTNNKMIASITWGVPAIVSNTPEYYSTAQKAGIGYAVFSNIDELISIIEVLKVPEARREYLNHAQPVIWNEFSPAVVTEKFLSICGEVKPQKFFLRIKSIFLSYLHA